MFVSSSLVPSFKVHKTFPATLGLLLYYRRLHAGLQSMVDEAKSKYLLNYKQDDQVKAILEVLGHIAVDAPISSITRLINSFNNVTSCRCLKN